MVNEFASDYRFDIHPRREAWRAEIETQRNAIYRACPRDLVVDREQALVRVGATMVTGVGALMTRRYVIRGLLGDGFTRAEVARALAASTDELDRAQSKLPIHEPGAKQLAELLARVIPSGAPVVDEQRSMSNAERRQGNLVRGSRGFRQPEDWPQPTTTPPHA